MTGAAGPSSAIAIADARPASAARSLPTLRPARFEDYPQIQRLESSHGLLTLSEEDWRHIWRDHPLIDRLGTDWPIGWVLEDGEGKIIGSLANVPSLYTFEGRELIAATGRAWVVAEPFRGIALWLMDEYFNQPGVDLFVNTTVNSMAVDPFTAFGSKRVPLGDWELASYWITGYRGFARAALRIKRAPLSGVISYPAGAILRAKDLATMKPLPTCDSSVTIESRDGFDATFDTFWRELVARSPRKLLNVRDSRTLSWHFAGALRAGHAWIFAAMRGGLMRAYCVVKRQDHPPSGLVRMRLVDYQSVDDNDLLPSLLDAALRRCRREGIHTFEHVGRALPKMRAFDDHAPYRRRLLAWPYYFHATDASIHARLNNPEAWNPSTYDGDASL